MNMNDMQLPGLTWPEALMLYYDFVGKHASRMCPECHNTYIRNTAIGEGLEAAKDAYETIMRKAADLWDTPEKAWEAFVYFHNMEKEEEGGNTH